MRSIFKPRPLWSALLAILLLGLITTPAQAAGKPAQHSGQQHGTTSLNATIYLSRSTLVSLFQSNINSAIPAAVNSAIASTVSSLPSRDQDWAYQMATTLIQPSAALVSLTPRSGGLATTIRLSLYPGDPKPITSSMLISFSVASASTVQVSARPLNGSPALVTGPLTTFSIPIGQLNSVRSTPGCGDSALAVNVSFPVTIGPLPTPPPPSNGFTAAVSTRMHHAGLTAINTVPRRTPNGVSTYVEIPSSSLAAIGATIGSWQIDNNLTAKNIQIGTQGSNLIITADIYLGSDFRLARTLTTIAPSASGGNLVVHVLSTDVTIFEIFTFPYDTYNQQIEQILNSVLRGALGNRFYVTNAAVGANGHIPCAANDSLILTGSASIG